MSRRQCGLDRLWRYYRCSQYEGRRYDWNGHENVGHIEHDIIAHSGAIPPGFYDAGGEMVPLKFREPSAPYHLVKVIVNRFSSLLFSNKRHPQIEADDPQTEDWLAGFAEATRLWSKMLKARTYGGAMGSVAVGFKFVRGRPHVEVHDPRWCIPRFTDRETFKVGRLEKLYQFVEQELNEDGEWEDVWYWYRRLITESSDIVWPKVEVEANESPSWAHESFTKVDHGFGFCPVVWIQNVEIDDDVDGDPDCHGIYQTTESIDGLWSQATRGTISNCDPGVVISSDSEFDEVRKGTGNALHVEQGGRVDYLEMDGGGVDKAMEVARELEKRAETVARVTLDRNEGGPSRTEVEVEHNYSSMIDQADTLREQYGEMGVKPLLEMVLKAARMMLESRVDRGGETPRIVRSSIKLPKRKVVDEASGEVLEWRERELGKGEQIELRWPQYFTPSSEMVEKAVDAAGKAKDYSLIDQDHATGYVAEYFGVENRAEMIKRIEAQKEAGLLPDVAEGIAGRTLERG
jgi:hypothetical protein